MGRGLTGGEYAAGCVCTRSAVEFVSVRPYERVGRETRCSGQGGGGKIRGVSVQEGVITYGLYDGEERRNTASGTERKNPSLPKLRVLGESPMTCASLPTNRI